MNQTVGALQLCPPSIFILANEVGKDALRKVTHSQRRRDGTDCGVVVCKHEAGQMLRPRRQPWMPTFAQALVVAAVGLLCVNQVVVGQVVNGRCCLVIGIQQRFTLCQRANPCPDKLPKSCACLSSRASAEATVARPAHA